MDSNHKMELLNIAIQRFIEEKTIKQASGDTLMIMDDNVDDQLLLSGLLSQLESLKEDVALKEPEASLTEIEEVSSAEVDNVETKMENIAGEVDGGSSVEEVVKELKEVKRQNFVTHCLLSALIVLTVAWQVSQVSLIWKLKDGFSHPFRSFGSAFSWILKRPDANGTQDAEKQFAAAKQRLTEAAASFPSVVIPEIPLVELPDLVLEGENH